MSEDLSGTLSRRLERGRLVWQLDWQTGDKRNRLQDSVVFRALPPALQGMRDADAPAGFTLPVFLALKFGKLERVWPADPDFAERAAREQAQRDEAARQEQQRKAEEQQKALGVPFPAPSKSWRRSGQAAHFHNPYNFVPAPAGLPGSGSPLAQGQPVGHHAYHPDRFSGRLTIDIEVVTPLIVGDTARARPGPEGHLTVDILQHDGKPVLPVTSLKGALRSAYEAVTVSRMGVFQGHSSKLARRMVPTEGLRQIPMRVSENGKGFDLFLGSHADLQLINNLPTSKQGISIPGDHTMYAAWLPRYDAGIGDPNGPRISRRNGVKCNVSGEYPVHGDHVLCLLQKYEKWKFNKKTKKMEFSFYYWRVIELVIDGRGGQLSTPTNRALGYIDENSKHRPSLDTSKNAPIFKIAHGIVCISNQNMGTKHDERVFFADREFHIDESENMEKWICDWGDLQKSYMESNKRALNNRVSNMENNTDIIRRRLSAFVDNKINGYAFSRHIVDQHSELKPGDLLYGQFQGDKLVAIYPVIISRELGDLAPEKYLPDNISPAETIDELSPADRVFGWVSQKGSAPDNRNMMRGQLRIRSVDYVSHPENRPIEDFTANRSMPLGLPLAILSTPKPQQARFYLAADRAGTPAQDGASADDSFYKGPKTEKALRGRKVYPHHRHVAGSADYWNAPAAVANPAGQVRIGPQTYYREYVRQGPPANRQDDQNRSIKGWINPGTRFAAEIDVTNLSREELGALAWLLTLNQDRPDAAADHVFRMGFGKPLGFGSVRISLTAVEIADGEAIAADYASLLAPETGGKRLLTVADLGAGPVAAYKQALSDLFAGKPDFEAIAVIKAFRVAARGFDDGHPVHYPRATPHDPPGALVPPNAEGKNYEWFVANVATGGKDKAPGPRLALASLWDPAAFPYLYVENKSEGGSGGGGRHR